MKTAGQVWLITGASSGFGAAMADAVLDAGGTVVGTFRKPAQCEAFAEKRPGRSFAVEMDVTDTTSVDRGVAQALEKCGRIDVVVNNAGYALRGLVEQVSDEEAWNQLDTNVMGIVRVTRAVLPSMRERGAGHIINISSAAGTVGFPMMSLYCASKFAVVGLTESTAIEGGLFGIKASCVEPGAFRTNFASSSMVTSSAPIPEGYAPLVEQLDASIASFDTNAKGDPVLAARRIVELAAMDEPPLRLALGDDAFGWITGSLKKRLAEYEAHAAMSEGTAS